MYPLYKYISQYAQLRADCHSHLFDAYGTLNGVCDIPDTYDKVVGFIDIDLDDMDNYRGDNLMSYYARFIKNEYLPNKHILLAAADNSYDAINIYLKWPDVIKGFGEFKCYDEYEGKMIHRDNLNWIRPVCDFDRNLHLPIYIHWSLVNESAVSELDKLLKDYPTIPFVLCHAGVGFKSEYEPYNFALRSCKKLYDDNRNLYIDISYKAIKYFAKHPEDLYNNFDKSRTFIGSDYNRKGADIFGDEFQNKVDKTYRLMDRFKEYSSLYYLQKIFSDRTNYVPEPSNTYKITSTYLSNIHTLPTDKQQHFVTRLNLTQPMDISKYMEDVYSQAEDIKTHIESSDYDYIIDKYIMPPYRIDVPELKKIASWIQSITDSGLKEILSVGVYADKCSILKRNEFKVPDFSYGEEFCNRVVKNKELLANEPTLYINCIGYIMNLTGEGLGVWRAARKNILSKSIDYKNIYGLTHILLQASNFYTKCISSEYAEEIELCNKILVEDKDEFRADTLCELALCLKYTNIHPETVEQAKIKLRRFIIDGMLINVCTNSFKGDIEANEHCNAMYVLLMNDNRTLK